MVYGMPWVFYFSLFYFLEVVKAQAKGKPVKESKYVDIYREKPVRVTTKVLVPVKEHPRVS